MVELNLIDVYSRWKDWVLAGNSGFQKAFNAVGGDIPAIPLYLFITNGWRIVPQSANHVLSVINGVLEVDDGVSDPFVDPVGSYKIRINRESPGIAIGYSTSGTSPTASEIATAVWQHSVATDITTKLAEAWGRLGLDITKPLVTGTTQITFGDIIMAISETNNVVTVSRQ